MIYLDYQATTPLAPEAFEAMVPLLRDQFANPHSAHRAGRAAAAQVEVARDEIARLLPPGGRLIFISGATEALNIAIQGAPPGGIVTIATEHAAVLDTVAALEAKGREVVILPVGSEGLIDLAAAREAITLAFARFDEESAKQLRERLHQTVLALCEDAVLPLALDTEGLARRVEAAATLLQRKTDERVIHLHPTDHALILPQVDPSLTLVPDPAIERGALRIDTDDGGVEDGPAQWRQAVAEALAQC